MSNVTITPNTGANLGITGGPAVRDRAPSLGSLAITGIAPQSYLPYTYTASPVAGALALAATAPVVLFGAPAIPASMEPLTAVGYGSAGGAATVVLQVITASGAQQDQIYAVGSPTLQSITAQGASPPSGVASLLSMQAAGVVSQYASGTAVLKALAIPSNSGDARLYQIVAYGTAYNSYPEPYATKVMNAKTGVVTEYTNFNFNSYARIGRDYYGASNEGLFLLDGDNDAGSDINWSFKTSQMDDKSSMLKRVPEIVVGLRASGPVRVRVWQDDNTYFDYMLPASKTNTINQQRVKCGKGMRSRYYAVELQGMANSAAEIDSLQIPMAKTSRRIG